MKSYNFSSDDIKPIINEIDTVDHLNQISDNPDPLINSVETSFTKSGGIIDKSLVVGKIDLNRILSPILPKYNLNYSDIEIIIVEIDTMSKLKEIERNPEYVLKSLLFVSKPLIYKLIMLGFMVNFLVVLTIVPALLQTDSLQIFSIHSQLEHHRQTSSLFL